MTTPPNARIIVMPFLQRWDGQNLQIRCVFLPQGSPLAPLEGSTGPSFSTANLEIEIHIVSGQALPEPGGSAFTTFPAPALATANQLFTDMASAIDIDPNPAKAQRPPGSTVSKYLPISYQSAVGYAPSGSSLFYTDNTYKCAMRHPRDKPILLSPANLTPSKLGWGHLIAMLLKDPALILASGLARDFTIPVSDATVFNGGAFLYCSVAASGDGAALAADPNGTKIYATHVPQLIAKTARPVFSPVLFPVLPIPPNLDYSELFSEVENYDDGWAKAVHCGQIQGFDPFNETDTARRPVKEAGIRLGWDDEQVTTWANRGIDSTQPEWDSPVGVNGYRVDARLKGSTAWNSLVSASGDIKAGSLNLGHQSAELTVSVHPSQLDAQLQGQFWLPMYYSNWYGPALLKGDALLSQLTALPPTPSIWTGDPLNVSLIYGNNYEFRVRLSDASLGGPALSDSQFTPGPSLIGSIDFKRYILPGAPLLSTILPITADPLNPPAVLTVQRPLLQYPAVTCIGKYTDVTQLLIDDIPVAAAANREPALSDLDVAQVLLTVQALEFPQDPLSTSSGYVTIFTATRAFPSQPDGELNISLDWQDVANVYDMPPDAGSGNLILPTARTIRILMQAVCQGYSNQPNYYGGVDVMTGPTLTTKDIRKNSTSEAGLWGPLLPSQQFSGYFMQPDSSNSATANADALARFATALNLPLKGSTIRAPQGSRVIFGCCSSLSKTIGPDGASITFSNKAAVTLRWLMAVSAVIERDWTWDGFANPALTVKKDGVTVGTVDVPFSLSNDAVTGATADVIQAARTQTKIIFFDLINPQPDPSALPQVISPVYTITPAFQGSPSSDSPLSYAIRLPVTTPPKQPPKLVSAGIAMSPYTRAPDYSWTSARQKHLWLEFDQPLADPRDCWFGRVLRNVPDVEVFPDGNIPIENPLPPLPIDPELVRQIVPGQAADEAGLGAMTQLIPADKSDVHYMLPLPVEANDPQLFGFWTYEFRAGHAKLADATQEIWSTAQGRYGPALLVNGLQHPPPVLPCKATRVNGGISVQAPHAVGVANGSMYESTLTSLWFLIYAQAAQVDGADFRNVLLGRVREAKQKPRRVPYVTQPFWGNTLFPDSGIQDALTRLGFSTRTSLSVLAVEMAYSETAFGDPLGADLGKQRILRISNLTPVAPSC